MTTINMQYWLGANERTHVLPTDKWYLDFATSILPLVKTSPLFNKEDLRTQIDAAISLGMYFQDAIAQSGGWKLSPKPFKEYTELTCRSIHWVTIIRPMK